MNKKLILIGTILIAMTGFLYINYLQNGGSGPLKSYKEIEQLRSSIKFKFNVPRILMDEQDLKFENINNQMIVISNNNIKFCAAKFINNKVSVGGDYSKYGIDKQYSVSGDTIIKQLRIRTNSSNIEDMGNATLDYNTGDIAYSLKINKKCSYQSILGILELQKEQLNEVDNQNDKSVKDNSTTNEQSKTLTNTSKKEASDITIKEMDYTVYTIKSMKCSIRIPKTVHQISIVEDNTEHKYATFFILNKVVFSIEAPNKSDSSEQSELIKCKKLKNGYTLKYYKDSPFKSGDPGYDSYKSLTNSVDYIANSFQPITNKAPQETS